MHILEYNNFRVTPTEECFMIKPLRLLYTKDKTKDKENFMLLISILYHMVDPRSSYSYITDEEDRFEKIKEEEGLPASYKISKELELAMNAYREHIVTTSFLLLLDTRVAIDKVREFLRNVDLYATDDKGKPLYPILSITAAVKTVPLLAKDLLEVEKTIAKEIEEEGRARGIAQKKLFEDGV